MFGFGVIVHVQVVPAGTVSLPVCVGDTVNAEPLQIVAVLLVITGLGFTVTVIVKVGPVQIFGAVPDDGVTVQVIVCTVFVKLYNV